MSRSVQLPDEQATQRLGEALAHCCPWGLPGARCVFLSGALGSGKTTLAAALLAAAGVRESVRSPTYALVETYPLGARLGVHVDLYRLSGAEELEQLGLREQLQSGTLLLVEWPERALAGLPQPDLWVHLRSAGAGRRAQLQAHSAAGAAWLVTLSGTFPVSEDG